MNFTVKCPLCQQSLEADSSLIDEKVDCPSCGGSFVVSRPSKNISSADSQKEPTTKMVKCPKCHGKGESSCWRCFGKGKLVCLKCTGKGKKTCPSCGGRGKFDETSVTGGKLGSRYGGGVTVTTKQCLTCSGRGVLNELCPACQGSGHETCGHCGGRGRVKCDLCSGAKQVSYEVFRQYQEKKAARNKVLMWCGFGCLGGLVLMFVFMLVTALIGALTGERPARRGIPQEETVERKAQIENVSSSDDARKSAISPPLSPAHEKQETNHGDKAATPRLDKRAILERTVQDMQDVTEKELLQLAQENPGDKDVSLTLGHFYVARGKKAKNKDDFAKAQKLLEAGIGENLKRRVGGDSIEGRGRFDLACICYYEKKDYVRAKKLLDSIFPPTYIGKSSLDKMGAASDRHLLEARVYEKNKDYKKAVESYSYYFLPILAKEHFPKNEEKRFYHFCELAFSGKYGYLENYFKRGGCYVRDADMILACRNKKLILAIEKLIKNNSIANDIRRHYGMKGR